jgi:16S rRNA (uracil1498-N3)-methyltransferase
MFNFFVERENLQQNIFYIKGNDYNHIKNVLRMQSGDEFLVSCDGVSNLCRLQDFTADTVLAEILEENYQNTELSTKIYLFQGIAKGEKMEWIIQKCVELGCFEIIPTEMSRCVVKIEEKKKRSKQTRWQAISESAAKQSKRTVIPKVLEPMSFKNALNYAKDLDLVLVPYENKRGMIATKEALQTIKNGSKIGIFIGPEGGFSENEIEALTSISGKTVSLGSRILRTETAAITAVSMCMLYTEMNGETE